MTPTLYQILVSKSKTNMGEGDWQCIFVYPNNNAFILQQQITGFTRMYSSEELDTFFHTLS